VFSGNSDSSEPRQGRGELLLKTLLRASVFTFSPWKLSAAETGVCWSRLCRLAAVLAACLIKIVYASMVVMYMINILSAAKYNICVIPEKHYSSLFRFRLVFYTDMLLIYLKTYRNIVCLKDSFVPT
jgi:hypothetical protein